jgi:hypothetical protein
MDRPIGFFWMGLMFLAIGLPATIGCLWLVNAERGRTMWPTVEGLVLSSKASPYVSGSSKGPNQLMYRPAVTYAYAIDGREYKSHRIGPSVWGTSSQSFVDDYLVRYRVHERVKVHYDPRDPAQARLEVGVETVHVIGILVSLLFDGLGISMMVLWRRRAHRVATNW